VNLNKVVVAGLIDAAQQAASAKGRPEGNHDRHRQRHAAVSSEPGGRRRSIRPTRKNMHGVCGLSTGPLRHRASTPSPCAASAPTTACSPPQRTRRLQASTPTGKATDRSPDISSCHDSVPCGEPKIVIASRCAQCACPRALQCRERSRRSRQRKHLPRTYGLCRTLSGHCGIGAFYILRLLACCLQ